MKSGQLAKVIKRYETLACVPRGIVARKKGGTDLNDMIAVIVLDTFDHFTSELFDQSISLILQYMLKGLLHHLPMSATPINPS